MPFIYECNPAYFEILPKEGIISPNSSIIMQGNLRGDFFKNIQSEEKVYLISKLDTVKLQVVEYKSINDYSQVFFKPTKILKSRQTYFLYIKGEYNPFSDEGNYSTWVNQNSRWTTSIDIDTTPPKVIKQAKLKNKHSNYFAGGGYNYVAKFSIDYSDLNKTLALVQLKNEKNNEIKELYVPIVDSMISVSGSVCLNKFKLTSDIVFKARFKLIDYSLNQSIEWSEWQEFEFDNPFPKIIEK